MFPKTHLDPFREGGELMIGQGDEYLIGGRVDGCLISVLRKGSSDCVCRIDCGAPDFIVEIIGEQCIELGAAQAPLGK